jgi:hypothetical protein
MTPSEAIPCKWKKIDYQQFNMKVSVPTRIILLILLTVLHQRGLVASDATESFSSHSLVSGMPPACICATPSSHPCLDFDCKCECDLNTDTCDDNCCCDPDCGQADKAQFSIEVCPITAQPSTTASNLGRMCYDDPSLLKINPKYPLQLDDAVEVCTQKGLLCVWFSLPFLFLETFNFIPPSPPPSQMNRKVSVGYSASR